MEHRGKKIIITSHSGKTDKVKEAMDVLMEGYTIKDK